MEVTARIAKGAASARPSSAPFVLPLFTHGAVINGQTVFLAPSQSLVASQTAGAQYSRYASTFWF
jgi:hypothetical protein